MSESTFPAGAEMKVADLRRLGSLLNKAFTCPTCGKSKLVRAVSHQGRGTGRHGESYYGPTAFEQITEDTHCMCPPPAATPDGRRESDV